jgi:hypothetical protein
MTSAAVNSGTKFRIILGTLVSQLGDNRRQVVGVASKENPMIQTSRQEVFEPLKV